MRYIGSKAALLQEIRGLVDEQAPNSQTFCDIFAGTGVVGREFKGTHKLVSNDILHFSYVLNAAYIGLKCRPVFSELERELGQDPIDYLNAIQVSVADIRPQDFMALSYSPAGEARRQYLTTENALLIDRMRQQINTWLEQGLIGSDEWHYLLACLIEEVPSVSNTTGTYGAYLKHWDNRARKQIKLQHILITQTENENQVFNEDANALIRRLTGDVLYLDTPYNGRQYSSNYHLLESLSLYDNPMLKGVTGTRVDKSGESQYCKKGSVFDAFDDLLSNADFGTILISYSSDGLLTEEQLTHLLTKHGKDETLKFRKIPYRRYKRTANDERIVLEYLIAVNR